MAERIVINSASKLSEAINCVTRLYREKKFLILSLREGKTGQSFKTTSGFLYERIAQMTNIGDVEDARSYRKLHIGVRILLRDCADYRETWDRLFLHWSYEDKLALMGAHPVAGPEGLAVTRLFNRKQGIEYTDRIVAEFAGRGVFFGDLLGGGRGMTKQTKLTKAARGRDCQVRLPGCPNNTETTVLAHYRLAGTCGMGIKPNNLQGAWTDDYCHSICDGRTKAPEGMTREDIRLAHAEGVMRTIDILVREGVVAA